MTTDKKRSSKRNAKRAAALRHVSDLQPDPRNARRHDQRNVEMIDRSLEEVGAARSVVIDERGVVLAGNATVEAAKKAGLKLKVIDTDGKTLVAVRRRGLDARSKRRLALYDNRTGELSSWSADKLQAVSADDQEFLATLFTPGELKSVLELQSEAGNNDAASHMSGLEYRIVVLCESEKHQAELLQRFESEGLSCQVLIS